ncbi:hypothetical protein niasHT_007755 [Heterodera trifolii]|uniref:Uncharacterized protein n=1 Tax=Heterodera trifolii TaxID=157864 RepID=A0ABD2LM54_9BILA
MDWLQRHFMAVASSISPTRNNSRRSPIKRGNGRRTWKRARSEPATVDIDQRTILLARSSSSSSVSTEGADKLHKIGPPTAHEIANALKRKRRKAEGHAPKKNNRSSVPLKHSVSFAVDSSGGSQLFIEDTDFGLITLEDAQKVPFQSKAFEWNGKERDNGQQRKCSVLSNGFVSFPSAHQQHFPSELNAHNSDHFHSHHLDNEAFQYDPSCSPLPIRQCPQLIAWPPVPIANHSSRSAGDQFQIHPQSSALESTREATTAATTIASAISCPSGVGQQKVPLCLLPHGHLLSFPLTSLQSAARQLLFSQRTHFRRQSLPKGAAISDCSKQIEYRRVPETEEDEEGQAQQRRRKKQQQQRLPPQRRVLPPRRPRAVRPSFVSPSSSSSRRPISSACPQQQITDSSSEEMVRPYKLDVVLHMPEQCPEELTRHAWNPEDRSLNLYVKEEDVLTLHRHPVAQSTDGMRGKIGYTRGFHVWQLNWPVNQRGTHAVVGVATKDAPLHAPGYVSLIGADAEGFGWNIVENKCYHDAQNTKPWSFPYEQSFVAPEKLFCVLDMDEGQLAFATDSKYLGVAFRGLKGKKLYPAVSAVWGHCEITLKYLGGLDPEPRQLMDICRRSIRLSVGKARMERISELNLPPSLRHYLLYK